MEMILIVVLSIALGALSAVFYFVCIKDQNFQFKFHTEKEDKVIQQIQASGDHLVSVNDPNRKLTLRNRLDQAKEFIIFHKSKVGFCVLFIVACIVGAWIGYSLMMNVNDIIRENKKATTLGMIMIEPDSIHVKHLDDGSRIKYL